MRIAMIYAGIRGYEHKLDKVTEIITNTLSELDEYEIDNLILSTLSAQYYNGKNAEEIADFAENIKNANAVIFAATAGVYGPNALMLNFMEHLNDKKYKDLLKNKNCLIVVTSNEGGERAASNVISSMIADLKGFDAERILVGACYLDKLENDGELTEIIERQTEDYYRIIRQNRKFFIPSTAEKITPAAKNDTQIEPMTKREIEVLFGIDKVPGYKAEDILQKYNIDPMDNNQSKDLNELTKFFAKKYAKDKQKETLVDKGEKAIEIDYSAVKPREKTCRQITKSLPHYFKPQYAEGLNIVFQLMISAKDPEDSVEGYLTISDNECSFEEGIADNIDITIMGDEKAWLDVVKGKNTAQKAFMIGQLKVRGNFIHLSKLDQIFNFSMAVI